MFSTSNKLGGTLSEAKWCSPRVRVAEPRAASGVRAACRRLGAARSDRKRRQAGRTPKASRRSCPNWLLLTCGILAVTLAVSAAEPTHRVVVPKLSGPVQIDGNLDEAVWAKAVVLQPFTCNKDGSPAREHTELRLWYDHQALYLGWTCQDTNILAAMTNRDAPLYQEDAVEFFVTARELTNYYEFEWNALGTVFDAAIRNQLRTNGLSRTFTGDSSYTARNMETAAQVNGQLNQPGAQDQCWRLEVRLPFADLKQRRPRPREVWRFDAFRVNHTPGLATELSSWAPTRSPSFHEPGRFGYLEFGE